jgi:hypothetical protein
LPHLLRIARPALALGLACATMLTARAAAAAPACEASYLALEEGVVWTYERAVREDDDGGAAQPGQIAVKIPTELTIEVASVENRQGATVIELVERFGDIEQKTEVRCGDEGIRVSPHSFLAVGEAGGGIGILLEETDREGVSYPAELRPGQRWKEWVEASFTQTSAEGSGAAHPAGKIQVERNMRVFRRIRVEIGEKTYRPYRVDYSLSGRAMVEPEIDLGVEIPADAAGAMWFEPGVGLVKVVNRFGHDWSLTSRERRE